jgi:hypothetical protein
MKECWINVYGAVIYTKYYTSFGSFVHPSKLQAENAAMKKYIKYRLHVKLKDKPGLVHNTTNIYSQINE